MRGRSWEHGADELEAHRPWLQRIAAAILRDADRAEDCVQEVFLVALREGPARRSSLHSWLRSVLVNTARKAIDRDARRRFHEGIAVRERRPTLETEEQRELKEEIRRGVQVLRGRYRDVILLRYGEGLETREIAARWRVPVRQVETLLYRARLRLRERLNGRFDGYSAWAPIALAWLGARSATTRYATDGGRAGSAIPRGGRSVALRAAGAAACLVAASLFFARFVSARSPESARSVAVDPALAVLTPGPLEIPSTESAAAGDASRAPVEAPLPARADQTLLEPRPAALRTARVVDIDGEPLAELGLCIELFQGELGQLYSPELGWNESAVRQLDERYAVDRDVPPDRRTRSGPDGRFAFAAPEGEGWIDLAPEERATWALVSTVLVLEEPPIAEPTVRVARATALNGRVFDDGGRVLGPASVELMLVGALRQDFDSCDVVLEPSWSTDGGGSFEIEALPDVPGVGLRFSAQGYAPRELALAELRSEASPLRTGIGGEIEVRLARRSNERGITGRVVGPDGVPIADAVLSFEYEDWTTSDARGEFSLQPAPSRTLGTSGTLRAAALGFQPLVQELRADAQRWSDLDLVFAEPSLEMMGVVLRADGTPHARALVLVSTPEVLSSSSMLFVEQVTGDGQEGLVPPCAMTDTDGVFRLTGLRDAAYVLRVVERDTCEWFDSEPIPAGLIGAVLQFPPDGTHPLVRGRVVDRRGAPVARVSVARAYPHLDVALPDDRHVRKFHSGDPVATDAHGCFALEHVARRGLVNVSGSGIQSHTIQVEHEPDLLAVRIEVALTCRVAVERTTTAPAFDVISFATASGETVVATLTSSGGPVVATLRGPPHHPARVRLLLGPGTGGEPTTHFLVSDGADELVLWSNGVEIGRRPIALTPADLNVVSIE